MKYSTHGCGNGLDDLYLLPESVEEKEKLLEYIKTIPHQSFSYFWFEGKEAIELPFASSLVSELETKFEMKYWS